jgi:glycine cleavage system H protein
VSESNIPSELRCTRSHEWVRGLANGLVASNAELALRPELVNDDPYGEGWLIRVEVDPAAGVPVLLTAPEYAQFLAAM